MNQHSTLILPGPALADGTPTYAAMRFLKKLERTWRFAGGKIEENELPGKALVREAFEELGIIVHNIRLVTITKNIVDGTEWTGFWFLPEYWANSATIREHDKHRDLAFFTEPELRALGSIPEADVIQILHAQGELHG